eukprot:Ihof_evm6s215 gene=Ihof_evmTU6s215
MDHSSEEQPPITQVTDQHGPLNLENTTDPIVVLEPTTHIDPPQVTGGDRDMNVEVEPMDIIAHSSEDTETERSQDNMMVETSLHTDILPDINKPDSSEEVSALLLPSVEAAISMDGGGIEEVATLPIDNASNASNVVPVVTEKDRTEQQDRNDQIGATRDHPQERLNLVTDNTHLVDASIQGDTGVLKILTDQDSLQTASNMPATSTTPTTKESNTEILPIKTNVHLHPSIDTDNTTVMDTHMDLDSNTIVEEGHGKKKQAIKGLGRQVLAPKNDKGKHIAEGSGDESESSEEEEDEEEENEDELLPANMKVDAGILAKQGQILRDQLAIIDTEKEKEGSEESEHDDKSDQDTDEMEVMDLYHLYYPEDTDRMWPHSLAKGPRVLYLDDDLDLGPLEPLPPPYPCASYISDVLVTVEMVHMFRDTIFKEVFAKNNGRITFEMIVEAAHSYEESKAELHIEILLSLLNHLITDKGTSPRVPSFPPDEGVRMTEIGQRHTDIYNNFQETMGGHIKQKMLTRLTLAESLRLFLLSKSATNINVASSLPWPTMTKLNETIDDLAVKEVFELDADKRLLVGRFLCDLLCETDSVRLYMEHKEEEEVQLKKTLKQISTGSRQIEREYQRKEKEVKKIFRRLARKIRGRYKRQVQNAQAAYQMAKAKEAANLAANQLQQIETTSTITMSDEPLSVEPTDDIAALAGLTQLPATGQPSTTDSSLTTDSELVTDVASVGQSDPAIALEGPGIPPVPTISTIPTVPSQSETTAIATSSTTPVEISSSPLAPPENDKEEGVTLQTTATPVPVVTAVPLQSQASEEGDADGESSEKETEPLEFDPFEETPEYIELEKELEAELAKMETEKAEQEMKQKEKAQSVHNQMVENRRRQWLRPMGEDRTGRVWWGLHSSADYVFVQNVPGYAIDVEEFEKAKQEILAKLASGEESNLYLNDDKEPINESVQSTPMVLSNASKDSIASPKIKLEMEEDNNVKAEEGESNIVDGERDETGEGMTVSTQEPLNTDITMTLAENNNSVVTELGMIKEKEEKDSEEAVVEGKGEGEGEGEGSVVVKTELVASGTESDIKDIAKKDQAVFAENQVPFDPETWGFYTIEEAAKVCDMLYEKGAREHFLKQGLRAFLVSSAESSVPIPQNILLGQVT